MKNLRLVTAEHSTKQRPRGPVPSTLLKVNVPTTVQTLGNEGRPELTSETPPDQKHLGRCQGRGQGRTNRSCRPQNPACDSIRGPPVFLLSTMQLHTSPKSLSLFPVYLRIALTVQVTRGLCPPDIHEQTVARGLVPAGRAPPPREHWVKGLTDRSRVSVASPKETGTCGRPDCVPDVTLGGRLTGLPGNPSAVTG